MSSQANPTQINMPAEPSRFTFYVSCLQSHKPLLIILGLFSLITLHNAITLPLGEAADETDHYQYLRFVAQTGHPPLTETERAEAGFKGGLAPLYYVLTAWPIALIGEDTPPDIRRVDSRPERHIPTDGLGINHLLHTLDEQWPWRGQVLAWHLVRFLSLPLAWVTIITTYTLARRLLPDAKNVALFAAGFVAFLPRFVISSAVINDDNLVFALTALLLLTQVAILQGDHRPRTFATLGALIGLTLITKYFSLILIPEIILTLINYQLVIRNEQLGTANSASRPKTQSLIRNGFQAYHSWFNTSMMSFLLVLALTTGPWFAFITLRFNRVDQLGLIPGLAASLGEPQITEGLVGLLAGQSVRPPAATYSLAAWLGLLYRSFWFEYGWMRIFAPGWVYGLFSLILLVGLIGFIRERRHIRDLIEPRLQMLLGLHLGLFVIVVLARYILSATIDTGQGRHLYPALPLIALALALGLSHFQYWRFDPGAWRMPLVGPGSSGRVSLVMLLVGPGVIISLVTLSPVVYILPHYDTLPVTSTPPAGLPIPYRQNSPFAAGLSLAGYKVGDTVSAGGVLPVTLYWRAEQEAGQDYLVSLCVRDAQRRPAGCWRGRLGAGRYPARAWERGDTILDTIWIPLPACDRIEAASYHLYLELWPLDPGSATPAPEAAPVLAQTLTEPAITIGPTDALRDVSPTMDAWAVGQRLSGPTRLERNEALTLVSYLPDDDRSRLLFEAVGPEAAWLPLAQFDTPLYLPCAESPSPLARSVHFIAGPALEPGTYRLNGPEQLPDLAVALAGRRRSLEPMQSTLSFSATLSPLALSLPDQAEIDLTGVDDPVDPNAASRTTIRADQASLPVTIRWQARRWMADPLVVSLKLLDKDFMIGGERVATLGDRYPNVLWAPTEIVEETYPLRLRPDAPPGLYRLELSLIHQDEALPDGFEYLPLSDGLTLFGANLYPGVVRLLDPAHDQVPPQPFEAQLGESIDLIGHDTQSTFVLADGQLQAASVFLALYWQSGGPIDTDYTVFTQLLGPDGQIWAQWDNPPQAGRYPTSAWAAQDRVIDRYRLELRPGAPPGEYRLLVGMYDPATGDRLPVTINGQPQPSGAIELSRLMFGSRVTR